MKKKIGGFSSNASRHIALSAIEKKRERVSFIVVAVRGAKGKFVILFFVPKKNLCGMFPSASFAASFFSYVPPMPCRAFALPVKLTAASFLFFFVCFFRAVINVSTFFFHDNLS